MVMIYLIVGWVSSPAIEVTEGTLRAIEISLSILLSSFA